MSRGLGDVYKRQIQKSDVIDNLYISNIIEKKIKEIDSDNGYFNIEAKTYEIMTVGIAK